MFSGRDAGAPDEWDTQQVLDWMQGNDSSREEIKTRVMSVVRANELDGHTLRQLAAEKDEIQALFPALKDRLAFKFMLRKLFKEENPGFQYPTSIENQSTSPSGQAPQDVHPTSLHRAHPDSATSLWPNVHPAPATALNNSPGTLNAQPGYQLPAATDENYQPAGKKTRLFRNSYALPFSDPALVQKVQNFQPMMSAIPSGMQRSTAPANEQTNTNMLAYCLNPTVAGPPQAQRQVGQTRTLTHVVASAIPTSQPGNLATLLQTAKELSPAPEITSVVSLALNGDDPAPHLPPVYYPNVDQASRETSPPSTSPDPDPSIESPCMKTINYPAPLPKFSRDIEEMLRLHTNMVTTREMVTLLRRRLNYACARFYFGITNGQKLTQKDYGNIGRTVLEKYPQLAIDGESPPWLTFNKSLSQSIRNLRRLRNLKKTNYDSPQTSPEDSPGAVEGPVPVRLISLGQGEDSYDDDSVAKAIKEEVDER
ncbi:uncharacterized protein LOC119731759 isoform X2 [Patiria miniata]|uniref:Uncharacterized protein n=1 Tax=Patiria miniata TaxID=46514 RepID=A0A914AB00_PATMI|nr:uncharacterized protein LOC119731759 isoform X2 [Patiria miniata]